MPPIHSDLWPLGFSALNRELALKCFNYCVDAKWKFPLYDTYTLRPTVPVETVAWTTEVFHKIRICSSCPEDILCAHQNEFLQSNLEFGRNVYTLHMYFKNHEPIIHSITFSNCVIQYYSSNMYIPLAGIKCVNVMTVASLTGVILEYVPWHLHRGQVSTSSGTRWDKLLSVVLNLIENGCFIVICCEAVGRNWIFVVERQVVQYFLSGFAVCGVCTASRKSGSNEYLLRSSLTVNKYLTCIQLEWPYRQVAHAIFLPERQSTPSTLSTFTQTALPWHKVMSSGESWGCSVCMHKHWCDYSDMYLYTKSRVTLS